MRSTYLPNYISSGLIRTSGHLIGTYYDILLSASIQDINNHLDLIFRMDFRRDSGYAHIVDIIQSHIQILGDVVVMSTRDESQFILAAVDGDGVRVKGVFGFTDQIQLGPYFQMLEGLAAIPIAESGDVEIVQMDLLDGFDVFCSHNSFIIKVSETKLTRGCTRKRYSLVKSKKT